MFGFIPRPNPFSLKTIPLSKRNCIYTYKFVSEVIKFAMCFGVLNVVHSFLETILASWSKYFGLQEYAPKNN